jgi:hypothetical protein
VPAVSVHVQSDDLVNETVNSDIEYEKKVIAAISTAVHTSAGRNMNMMNMTPTQGTSFNMTPVWREKGINECTDNRLGSRSW